MEEETKSKKSKFYQVLLCCLANSSLLGSGMSLGFTAIALPYMQQAGSTLHVDPNQASWVASLASIATPVGCLLSGHLLDRYGRRTTLLINMLPLVVGWLLIGLQPSLSQLYLGRIFTGIGTGLCSVPATVYTAEVADISLRGILVTGTSFSIATGVVIVYMLGALLKSGWQLVALICAGFPVVTGLLVFFFLPESPVWLMAKNRIEDASNALMQINRATRPGQVKEELQLLAEQARKNNKRSLSLKTTLRAMTRPESYKPVIIMNMFFFFQQATGSFVVIFYAVDVVKGAGVTTDPFFVTVLIGIVRLIFTVVSAYMSKAFGRRPTALISGAGMTISLLILSMYIQYLPESTSRISPISTNITGLLNTTTPVLPAEPSQSVAYVPLTMLFVYICASTVGFLTLPWSMIGELYPSQIRGVAGGITTCVAYMVSFFILKLYPFMKISLETYGVFYFYGAMAFLGTIFIYIFLPETEGKTLQEIEQWFSSKGDNHNIRPEEEVALQKSKKATIVKSLQR